MEWEYDKFKLTLTKEKGKGKFSKKKMLEKRRALDSGDERPFLVSKTIRIFRGRHLRGGMGRRKERGRHGKKGVKKTPSTRSRLSHFRMMP